MDRLQPTAEEAVAQIKGRIDSFSSFEAAQLTKFMEGVKNMLPTGSGNSIRTRLLGLANHACMAGLEEDECFSILRDYIHGEREVEDAEIWGVIEKAWEEHDEDSNVPVTSTAKPRIAHKKKQPLSDAYVQQMLAMRDELIAAGQGATMKSIKASSPIRLPNKVKAHLREFLKTLYHPDEKIFLGDRYSKHVFNVKDTIHSLQFRQQMPEFIIPNSFCGLAIKSKTGNKPSRRCDAAVSGFKYAMAEFDDISLEDQLAFWSQINLPIVALIYSGSKSIHAWIRVDGVSCEDQWNTKVREQLYGQFLIPMGVDSSCRNCSRLSRAPGHDRVGKKMQHCFYLAPQGKAVFA